MLKILIPTDFSPIADNALNYAIEIGKRFESNLCLYHVYHIDRNFNYDSNFSDKEQPYKKKVEEKMNSTRLKFQEKITQSRLSIETKVEDSNVYSLFKEKVVEQGIDLIVMGSKGASGIEKFVFGSVAATALELAKVPLLVVPPNHSFHSLKKIVFATDHNEVSSSVLLPLQKLALEFGSNVTILNVKKDSDKDTQQTSILFDNKVETNYNEVLMSKNINKSINEFVEQDNCDLLCMIRRQKGFFYSLTHRSITKTQVYNSKVPLLILPEDWS